MTLRTSNPLETSFTVSNQIKQLQRDIELQLLKEIGGLDDPGENPPQ